MLREPGRTPTGARLLERGGMRALEHFYRSAPGPVRDSLRHSASGEVRAAMATFEGAEVLAVRSKDGAPIALWKSGTGPSSLVVHSAAADHTAWDGLVPLLATDFTVYTMDRRGRGASLVPHQPARASGAQRLQQRPGPLRAYTGPGARGRRRVDRAAAPRDVRANRAAGPERQCGSSTRTTACRPIRPRPKSWRPLCASSSSVRSAHPRPGGRR